MKITAQLNYLRIAPRKVRLVANLVKGMDVEVAETNLEFLGNRAASSLLKLLRSAVANATHNFNRSKEGLYIASITVGAGPTFKRFRARARGVAAPIRKRTSHVYLVLEERVGVKPRKLKKEIPKEVSVEVRKSDGTGGEEVRGGEKRTTIPTLRELKTKKLPKQSPGFVKRIFRRKSI